MPEDGNRYRIDDQIYTYHKLCEVTEAEVDDVPPETWRDGTFDYLTDSSRPAILR